MRGQAWAVILVLAFAFSGCSSPKVAKFNLVVSSDFQEAFDLHARIVRMDGRAVVDRDYRMPSTDHWYEGKVLDLYQIDSGEYRLNITVGDRWLEETQLINPGVIHWKVVVNRGNMSFGFLRSD